MSDPIAIVGMSCRYPDASSPSELWENVLAQRRSFRRMPAERLRLEDYLDTDRACADSTYIGEAAVIEGYEFDRLRYRVAGSTYRSADLAHWLALDVAAKAIEHAGFADGHGLPLETTGVLVGNTLTGEFARANSLRLRWPYVRRVIAGALDREGWQPDQRQRFLADLEEQYKAPFPPVTEETLAGGLSNTIAGRICNHFDFKGGGYTVDGACASSLLAVASACSALASRDLDVALAGGVDLSLDPFEIVGFAKTGALAPEEMRIYDTRSAGFWPGEGCGFVVLMRRADAIAGGHRIYVTIRGWGVSSDGRGGITRPEVDGQLLTLRRAYRRAGFGIDSIAYFEGHGTGTAVGDATELRTLAQARREANCQAPAAAIGSIKANIGHTKAAAGVAGLLKATMALQTQILPPTTGCEAPHPELNEDHPQLRVLTDGEPWPADRPLRAGVSAMGFGGINAHIVLESETSERKTLTSRERATLSSAQDAELFLLSAKDRGDLLRTVTDLAALAPRLSRGELADLAAALHARLTPASLRAAVVAATPAALAGGLQTLRDWLETETANRLDVSAGVFLGSGGETPRIGFLFPGQGSPSSLDGGRLSRRFGFVRDLYGQAALPRSGNGTSTEVAQPAIVTASLAALQVLDRLGVEAEVAVGHSLGELTALHWAGAIDEMGLLRVSRARGKAMAELGSPTGAMASIATDRSVTQALIDGAELVISGMNSPRQTVVSGEAAAVDQLIARARERGLRATRLPVSHAFHSPLVEAATPALAAQLAGETIGSLQRRVVSTVTGRCLSPDVELPALLCHQVTSPVRFLDAVAEADPDVDLWLEVGPGRVLSNLVAEFSVTPVVSLDAGGPSLGGLLRAAGLAWVIGAPVCHRPLFADRLTRPFDLDWQPRFFVNPCELVAPVIDTALEPQMVAVPKPLPSPDVVDAALATQPAEATIEVLRRLIAERVELPCEAVQNDDRLLGDLHLNSITVGELVAAAAQRLGLPAPVSPTDYADATVAGVAKALDELARTGGAPVEPETAPAGVDAWVRTFGVELKEQPLLRSPIGDGPGRWQVLASPAHPLASSVRLLLDTAPSGKGIVVCLPPEPDETCVPLLLEASKAALEDPEELRFVLVQHGGGAASWARTLHLEAPQITTCVVDVPADHPQSAEWVVAEALSASGYVEAHYDDRGLRQVPVLRLLPEPQVAGEIPLGPEDVLLVTGGGKGIAAESALALARDTGASLALFGRSHPADDGELAANLERMSAAGIHVHYVPVDVTDAEAVRVAIHESEQALGPITAALHGAGTNVPRLLSDLDEEAVRRTLAPKVFGARNILSALDPARLRLFIAFGSIIARTGMRGEADYGLANEWLARLVERYQAEHPACRCVVAEWSVWSGVGMGQRLGRVDALARQGITPIPPDEGVRIVRRLATKPHDTVSLIVTGRFGDAPTLAVAKPELPFLRFLEQPRVYYPGVELVVDAELSAETDPYLADHVFRGERLFPGVMALEAMVQAATALSPSPTPPVFEDVRFLRPVVVPEGARRRIRIAALVTAPDRIDVVLRSEMTDFQVDHFRATVRCAAAPSATPQTLSLELDGLAGDVPLVPERDLYGDILFHSGRFRRLIGYRDLRATRCLAIASSSGTKGWFGGYMPDELLLGDPAARDAAIHSLQACIPHAAILPIGVERLVIGTVNEPGRRFVSASERTRNGSTFVYDLVVADERGRVLEQWEGLTLQAVDTVAAGRTWAAPLLGPYFERRFQELVPGVAPAVAFNRGSGERRVRSDQAIQQAIGTQIRVWRRPDGKPVIPNRPELALSTAHAGGLTIAVAGCSPVGCDLEIVTDRPPDAWRNLLGRERFALAERIAVEAKEDLAVAATRVWAVAEAAKKAGTSANHLVFHANSEDGWVTIASGSHVCATCSLVVRGISDRLVAAVLAKGDPDADL
jgi:enediyne polyketide synthase